MARPDTKSSSILAFIPPIVPPRANTHTVGVLVYNYNGLHFIALLQVFIYNAMAYMGGEMAYLSTPTSSHPRVPTMFSLSERCRQRGKGKRCTVLYTVRQAWLLLRGGEREKLKNIFENLPPGAQGKGQPHVSLILNVCVVHAGTCRLQSFRGATTSSSPKSKPSPLAFVHNDTCFNPLSPPSSSTCYSLQ